MHMNTCGLLDSAKQKLGVSSDYALSKAFGVSRQKISEYRSGRHTLSDDKAISIAEFIGLDPTITMLEIQAERAERANQDAVARNLRDALRRLHKQARAA